MNRIAVYAFYDKDGIVDDYIFYYLQELLKFCSKIIVVVNGEIKKEFQDRLLVIGVELCIRENKGFDAYAYKFGIEKIENFAEYDELVLSNNSFFGPVFPLSEMFNCMESTALDKNGKGYDFWGCSIHPKCPGKIDRTQEFDYINEHVQTFFVVFKKRVLQSVSFKNFWNNLKIPNTFLEAVCLFEMRLTSFLSKSGFTYGSYIDPKYYGSVNAMILYPFETLVHSRCPFVKRKIFSEDYQNFFFVGEGDQSRKALSYLDHCAYNKSLIWQHLLRTTKMSELRMDLQLNFTLSAKYTSLENQEILANKKVALILYIYYEEAILECLNYVKNLPSSCHLFLVASKDSVYRKLRSIFESNSDCNLINSDIDFKKFKNIHFVKKRNKGRDVTTYLIDCKDVFYNYDYVCFIHDKKSPQLGSCLLTKSFFEHCVNSLLSSEAFVCNVIAQFENDPNLGLLVPPALHYGPFYPSEYNLHPNNKLWMQNIIDELHLNVPFDEFPVAPYGDMFWIRGKALHPLFRKDWSYDTDIPKEPIDCDGTILHALERIIPFVAQAAGYYSAWLCTEDTARTEINNLYYINKSINKEFFKNFIYCRHDDLIRMILTFGKEQNLISPFRSFDEYQLIDFKRRIKGLYRKKIKYQILNLLSLNMIPKLKNNIEVISKKINEL